MFRRAGQVIGGVVIPGLVHYIKHVHYQLTVASFIQTLFFGLAALITPTSLSLLMAVQFFAMLPFNWITMNCYTTASLNVPQRDLGVAIGLIGTFRSMGGAVGSVIFSSIFAQTSVPQVGRRISETALSAGVSPDSLPELIPSIIDTILGVPGGPESFPDIPASAYASCVSAARNGYAYGFRITWLASIAFGVVAIVCAAFVRDPSKYFTNHVEIHLNRKIGRSYEGGERAEKADR